MHSHSSSVFNNNCLKVPRNPKIDHPSPLYEQKYPYQLENQDKRMGLDLQDISKKKFIDKETTKEFLDFVNNIPEYDEINHLSNKEFYKKLENLKEKQRMYEDYLQNEIKFDGKDSEWIEDYKNLKLGVKTVNDKTKKRSLKPFCTTPILNKNIKNYNMDLELFSEKDVINKPPSRRSVRIETPSEKFSNNATPENIRPKSRANFSPSILKAVEWEDLSVEDLNIVSEPNNSYPLESKSASASPLRNRTNIMEDVGITIPKPFQMTVRDEENKIVDELFLTLKKPKEEKPEQFKAHDIPIESQIPLFDKIMADQERRSFITKEKRKAALQAQMKPFSFTKRDEEIQELNRELSKSSPSIFSDPPLKIKKFKAKPIPKNLFSNYIYKKMHEDEFYRALQKKIRAEELMRASSLPPAMAKRESTKPKMDVCPRSYRDSFSEDNQSKKSKRIPNFKAYHDRLEQELEDLKNEFISTSPRPFKLKTSKRSRKNNRNSSAASKSSSSKTMTSYSSLDFPCINRSNLAAVLRIQSARQKLEMDMMRKLEESKIKEEARWREKIFRKKPVWQALAYSHEEDLAMRLQLRREEERLRNEEHKLRMQMMLGRVNQQPTLFERQSQIPYPKTRDELVKQLYKEYGGRNRGQRSISDLSDMRSLVEMKDEAIQALLDDMNNSENNVNSKESVSKGSESTEEEKEKGDCSSEDHEKSS